MKTGKPIVFCLVLLAIIPIAFGLSVETNYPSEMVQFQESAAKITIHTEGQNVFDIVAILPLGWEITDWNTQVMDVFAEKRDTSYLGEMRSVYRWRIECQEETVELLLKIKPTTYGENKITTLWVYASGFNSADSSVFVSAPTVKPTAQNFMLLLLLLAATAIAIGGVAYREYLKIKSMKHKKIKRKKK